jgi:hypothetical protein
VPTCPQCQREHGWNDRLFCPQCAGTFIRPLTQRRYGPLTEGVSPVRVEPLGGLQGSSAGAQTAQERTVGRAERLAERLTQPERFEEPYPGYGQVNARLGRVQVGPETTGTMQPRRLRPVMPWAQLLRDYTRVVNEGQGDEETIVAPVLLRRVGTGDGLPILVNRTLEGETPFPEAAYREYQEAVRDLPPLPTSVLDYVRERADRLAAATARIREQVPGVPEGLDRQALQAFRERAAVARAAREIQEEEDGYILATMDGPRFPSFSEPYRRELMANEDALVDRILDEAGYGEFIGPRRTEWQHLLVEDEVEEPLPDKATATLNPIADHEPLVGRQNQWDHLRVGQGYEDVLALEIEDI